MEMKKYIIKLNGKTYEVEMGEVSGSSVYVAPTASAVSTNASATAPTPAAPSAAPAASTATGGDAIMSPMPGNIIDIRVKAGDLVKKNQVILVLEAMKMENEIVAPADGTVLSIATSKGAMVNANEELVRIG